MSKKSSIQSFLLMAVSASVLGACSASNDLAYNTQKTQAPVPPASVSFAKSTNTTPITTTTPEQRIAELEASVQSLRADYERIMPAFASLNTTNERIQTLLNELEGRGGIAKSADMAATSQTQAPQETAIEASVTKPIIPPMGTNITKFKDDEILATSEKMASDSAIISPAATNDPVMATAPVTSSKTMNSSVTAMRIGEHASKTRLVFDLSSKTKPDFSYDLDNEEKLLMIDMPSSSWDGKDSGKPANSLMVSGWSAQPLANGGSAVAIQLKKDARVLSTEFLKAEGKDPAKIVIDIGVGG